MAKHAVKVAVRNVVRVVTVPPQLAKGSEQGRRKEARVSTGRQPELLAGVSWDEGRRVWLVQPAPAARRG